MFRKLILNLEHFYIKVYKNTFAVGDVYESGATSFPDDFAFFNFEPQITLERIVSVTTFNVDKFLTFRIAKILNDDPRDNDRDLKKFHLKKNFKNLKISGSKNREFDSGTLLNDLF